MFEVNDRFDKSNIAIKKIKKSGESLFFYSIICRNYLRPM